MLRLIWLPADTFMAVSSVNSPFRGDTWKLWLWTTAWYTSMIFIFNIYQQYQKTASKSCMHCAKGDFPHAQYAFLANVNSRSRSRYAIARPSSVCLSSVTFVRRTPTVEIFRNVSSPFGTFATRTHSQKFYGDRPRGTPQSGHSGELNTMGSQI